MENIIMEKLAMVLLLFGFKPIEEEERKRAYIWRMKKVSSKIARNYVLVIARTFGQDYSFGVRYNGPKGMMQKVGEYSCFIENPGEVWCPRWVLDVYSGDDCVGSFVFFIQ